MVFLLPAMQQCCSTNITEQEFTAALPLLTLMQCSCVYADQYGMSGITACIRTDRLLQGLRKQALLSAHPALYTVMLQVAHCIELELQAQRLDPYLGSRSYGRLHPRYTLNSSLYSSLYSS